MKIKTSELRIAALDWAVAKCEGTLPASYDDWKQTWPQYATLWVHGGLIIEREKIELVPSVGGSLWYAESLRGHVRAERCTTPLIAAMRVYVASRLGDEVDVPDELVADRELPSA